MGVDTVFWEAVALVIQLYLWLGVIECRVEELTACWVEHALLFLVVLQLHL